MLSGSAALALLLCGCVGHPAMRTGAPLAMTAAQPPAPSAPVDADAPLVLAEMPDAGVSGLEPAAPGPAPSAPSAARPEPRSAEDVASIEAELELIAAQRTEAASAREMAALEARARELKRLAVAAQDAALRR